MRFLILTFFIGSSAFAQVGERIRHTVNSRDCENMQVQELEIREFGIRGDHNNFQRRHELFAICEVFVRLPDIAPIRVIQDRSQTKILDINGEKVRIILARKCYARERVNNLNRDAADPTLGESTKKAKETCLAKAKQLLETSPELTLDFDIQPAE